MKKYKVIKGKRKENYKPTADAYRDALIKLIAKEELTVDPSIETHKELKRTHPDLFMKKLYLMIKTVNSGYCSTQVYPPEAWEDMFFMTESINSMISHMTPAEFEIAFPITKIYHGRKYHISDYYHTKGVMERMGKDTVIGQDNVMEFLQNYCNGDICFYIITLTGIQMHVRKYRNGVDFMSEFADEIFGELDKFSKKRGYKIDAVTNENEAKRKRVSSRNRKIFKIVK